MAIQNPLLLSAFLLLLALLPTTSAMTENDLDAAISALRSRGYTLFGNSITVSDVHFDLLRSNTSEFTLFASTDTDLYNLCIASSADSYIRALRRHVALGRHFLPDLRSGGGAAIPTLLPQRILRISLRSADRLTANGVEIVAPGIYEGPYVVVHGLSNVSAVPFPPRSAHLTPAASPASISPESAHFSTISAPEESAASPGPAMLRSEASARSMTPAASVTPVLSPEMTEAVPPTPAAGESIDLSPISPPEESAPDPLPAMVKSEAPARMKTPMAFLTALLSPAMSPLGELGAPTAYSPVSGGGSCVAAAGCTAGCQPVLSTEDGL